MLMSLRNTIGVLALALTWAGPAAAQTYQPLHIFQDGPFEPAGGLCRGADGALYGQTQQGGDHAGTIFKVNPDGTGFTKIHDVGYNFLLGTSGLLCSGSTLFGTYGN